MTPFRHVLVPVDFGVATDAAVDAAVSLARAFGAKVTLFHAFDASPFVAVQPYAPVIDLEPVFASLEKTLAALRDRVAKSSGLPVEGVLVRGDVYAAIVEAAKSHHADLIVIGTHGRRGLAHALLGSVAEKVVRLAPVPVLTVHPAPAAAG
jgi:nucleotide-binding universal stress UspA family protein